jgi:hypothetical protein
MSRTYRRKNSTGFDCTYENELVPLPTGGWHWHRRFLKGKELKQALANFHSDTPRWNWSVPSDFVRTKNRKLRSKNKAILNRAIRNLNDEPMFIPYIHDALYDYW